MRAVKEEKNYLWDWSSVEIEGLRFENMVASHLLKYYHFIEDTEGDSIELRFLRDHDKREVDFVVLKNASFTLRPIFERTLSLSLSFSYGAVVGHKLLAISLSMPL